MDPSPGSASVSSAFDLDSLDDAGKPPKESRLRDVTSGRAIFQKLEEADKESSANRAKIQAMFDGKPPYDEAKLRRTGQSSRANLNFGEGSRYLDTALAGYVDLVNGVDTIPRIHTQLGDHADRFAADQIIAEEATRMIRRWPDWHSSFLRLATLFLGHGVGFTIFENESDWRFKVTGMDRFKLPRQTEASEDAIEVAGARQEYLVHELYDFIKDEAAATTAGWDVDLVKRAITTAAKSKTGPQLNDWERLQSELKNNDLFVSATSDKVSVIHMWVREMNGTVSHFIFTEENLGSTHDGQDGFLYKNVGRFKRPDQAFIGFGWGVGTNGTWHSIRGLGYKIFPAVQESNRLRCQFLDSAKLAGSIILQPPSRQALGELALQYYGPYAVLAPDLDVVDKVVPNLSTAVVPALNELSQQMAANLDFYSTKGAFTTSRERTRYEVEAELEQTARLSTVSQNLFYSAYNRLVREMVRRMFNPKLKRTDPGGEEALEMRERILARGVPPEIMMSIDHTRTLAERAIGAGSASVRAGVLRELETMASRFDATGRHNLTRDRAAGLLGGYELAERYVPRLEQGRPTVDAKLAELENAHLLDGDPISVSEIELHTEHLGKHLPTLNEVIEAVETGEVDPVSVMQGLVALFEHCVAHFEFIEPDPLIEGFVNQVRENLQQAGEIVANTSKKIQRMQREGQDPNGGPPDGQPDDASMLKVQELNLKLQFAQEKHDQEMRHRDEKQAQELRLRDAEAQAQLVPPGVF